MAVKIFTKQITSWDKLPVLLDIGTVCCLLKCSEVTVVRHIKAGHFKGNKLGSAWRIDRDSVRAYFTGEVTDRVCANDA